MHRDNQKLPDNALATIPTEEGELVRIGKIGGCMGKRGPWFVSHEFRESFVDLRFCLNNFVR